VRYLAAPPPGCETLVESDPPLRYRGPDNIRFRGAYD